MARQTDSHKVNAKKILERFENLIVKTNKGIHTRRDICASDVKELFGNLGNNVKMSTVKKMRDGQNPRPEHLRVNFCNTRSVWLQRSRTP